MTARRVDRPRSNHRPSCLGAFVAWAVVLGAVAVFVFGLMWLRQHEIDRCHNRGGQPSVPAWWHRDQLDVRCVYPAAPERGERERR